MFQSTSGKPRSFVRTQPHVKFCTEKSDKKSKVAFPKPAPARHHKRQIQKSWHNLPRFISSIKMAKTPAVGKKAAKTPKKAGGKGGRSKKRVESYR